MADIAKKLARCSSAAQVERMLRGNGKIIIDAQAIRAAERAMCERAASLLLPTVWSEEERDGMSRVYTKADSEHGHYETLFAVATWILKRRAAAIRKLADG